MEKKKGLSKDFSKNLSVRELGNWIGYQLRRRGIRQHSIARKIGISRESITQAIWGRRHSEAARAAIANALGYENWDELINNQRSCA
jgi:transcriptional regulator with XRE-family HTH domain